MKTLHDGQMIRTTMDVCEPVVTVGTVEGYAEEYGEDSAEEYKNAVALDHSTAWTHKRSPFLTADYRGKEDDRKKVEEAYKNAVLIENGEHVLIEGREYKAVYSGMQYSDPVLFKPVEEK